jgi:hypothetical protein
MREKKLELLKEMISGLSRVAELQGFDEGRIPGELRRRSG